MKKLVVVGNGIAAGALLVELQRLGTEKYHVSVFGEEATPAYNRVLLSNVVAGEQSIEDIALQSESWYQKYNINCWINTRIQSIDTKLKTLCTESGQEYPYDVLVLATGANARALDIPGTSLDGVMQFRSMDDAKSLQSIANTEGRTVVLGGGLLGLEAAAGLARHGSDVTVVHRNSFLMNRQLDAAASSLLQDELANRGIKFKLGSTPVSLVGSAKVEGVELDDGSLLTANHIVQAAGITPNISLAQASSIRCREGVLVDDYLQTYSEDVYALGECCEHNGHTVGLVSPIRDQAKILARVLHGDRSVSYRPAPTATQLKISGIQLYSAGELKAQEKTTEEIVLRVPASHHSITSYRKLLIRNSRIIGVVLFGDTSDSHWYFEQMQSEKDIEEQRENLLFGQIFCA